MREMNMLNNTVWSWTDGSLAKNTDSSCRGPGFDSQYQYDGLQLSVISAPRGSGTRQACRTQIECSIYTNFN